MAGGARRALSHVGGRILLRGGDGELRRVLRGALQVSPDELRTRRHVHGFHPYPARLHPDTANRLIEGLSKEGEVVLDPFCGSGTVLVEARSLGRRGVGVDANPLSVALARFKLGADDSQARGRWLRAAFAVAKAADRERCAGVQGVAGIDKQDEDLFSPRMLSELGLLRTQIAAVDDAATRTALLLVLSSMLNKVSRRVDDGGEKARVAERPSGFAIRFFKDRAQEVGRQMLDFARSLAPEAPECAVDLGDARELASVADGYASLIVTSPPYPGVYDYFSHHAARIRWLELDAQHLAQREIGAKRELSRLQGEEALDAWRRDLVDFLRQMRRVLRPDGAACLVLADTAAAGTVFPADELVRASAQAADLRWVATASQDRPHFDAMARRLFAGRPKREHLILLRPAGDPVQSPHA